MTAKTVIRSFLETTSIKGVSKATKSHVRFLRVSWTICILFGLSMTVYFLWNTLREYYKFEYTTNFIEHRVAPPFPDVTICKINPILFKGKDAKDYTEYKKVLQEHNDMNKHNTSEDSLMHRRRMQEFLLDLTGRVGYFQYIDASRILHEFNKSFVLHCEVRFWTGQNRRCEHRVVQEPIFLQPDTPLCVKLTPNVTDRSSIRSIETILFIDDNRCDEDTDLSVQNLLTVGGDGVFVLPHGTMVEPAKHDGLRVPPGVEMDILIQGHRFERLDNPYSNCSKNIKTSDEVCVLACSQDMVIKKCRCLDPYLPTTIDQRNRHTFCGNVSVNHTIFKQRVECLLYDRNWTKEEKVCTEKCFPPCQETRYELKQAFSKWPHEIFRTVLYSLVKDNPALSKDVLKAIYCSIKHDKDTKIFGESFESIDEFISMDESIIGQNDSSETLDCDDDTFMSRCPKQPTQDAITRNFIKVNIILTRRILDVSIDTPKLSLYQVYGTVGGTLNLWIGITFVTLIELAELLYNLIKDRFNDDKVQNIDNSEKKEAPK